MKLDGSDMEKTIRSSLEYNRLEPSQIPDLDLYMDQIITLFEDKLGDCRRRKNDKILTKSMVNNYSKEKLIRPIKGKKYSREQVLQILLIFNLKNTLSIGDIKLVMGKLMEEGQTVSDLEQIFQPYAGSGETVSSLSDAILDNLRQNYAEELDTVEVVSVLLGLAGLSNYLKRTAEQIVDQYFTSETKEAEK